MNTEKKFTALQLAGSPTSQFFFDLSVLYAAKVVQPPGFTLLFAIAYPDGQWSVNKTLDINAKRVSLQDMISLVTGADLVVPHMFCPAGLTSLRTLFEDTLQIPLVGSSGHTLAITQDKYLTRLVAEDSGVCVPVGRKVLACAEAGELAENLGLPLIIKPNCADNSEGLTLAVAEDDIAPAIEEALQYDAVVLAEEFVPGREIRAALLETNGDYTALPFIEYIVSDENPIRQKADKLKLDGSGKLLQQSEKKKIPAQCPATVDDELREKITSSMVTLHNALGCRDFSMFDFRIHRETGEPFLLEAGLFWSFSPTSMISNMLEAADKDLTEVTATLWRQTLERNTRLLS